MSKLGSWSQGALLLCLALAGCESGTHDDAELAGKSEDLARPGESADGEGEPKAPSDKVPGEKPGASKPGQSPAAGDAKPKPAGDASVSVPCDPAAPDAGGSAITCANVRCAAGTTCVDHPSGPECVANAGCAATLCEVGTVCVEGDRGAVCVPNNAGCAATLCAVGTVCVEGDRGATCVPQASCDPECGAGTRCELIAPPCPAGAGPCPSQPTCVPDVAIDQCAAVRCRGGTHCEVQEVQCIRAPCNPVVTCVPD
jgi:hypothetical protein